MILGQYPAAPCSPGPLFYCWIPPPLARYPPDTPPKKEERGSNREGLGVLLRDRLRCTEDNCSESPDVENILFHKVWFLLPPRRKGSKMRKNCTKSGQNPRNWRFSRWGGRLFCWNGKNLGHSNLDGFATQAKVQIWISLVFLGKMTRIQKKEGFTQTPPSRYGPSFFPF